MDIILKPKKIVLALSLVVAFFTLANIGALYLIAAYPPGTVDWLIILFHANLEGNLPTTYSWLSMLFCSVLLFVIYSRKRRSGDAFSAHWFWLAVIFLFLSMDEAVELHAILGGVLKLYVDTSALVTKFTWLVPYAVFVCVFAAAYLRFLASLPSRSRWLIVAAGAVYVAGAWGCEFITDRIIKAGIEDGPVHLVLYSVEEFLEMSGIVLFIHALMSYMVVEFKEAGIRLVSRPSPPRRRGGRGLTDIILKPEKLALGFSLVVVFLTVANIGAQYIRLNYRDAMLRPLARLFSVPQEANLPTMYSCVSLLFCAALLFVIYSYKRKLGDAFSGHWLWLAVIFLILSIDEASSLHEMSSHLVRLVLDTSRSLDDFPWLLPYGVFVCVFALAYRRFLRALPGSTRWLFVAAGVAFVAGAWGLKLYADFRIDDPQMGRLEVFVLYSIEELLEMTGVVVFIYALASYIKSEGVEARIRQAPSL